MRISTDDTSDLAVDGDNARVVYDCLGRQHM